MAKQRRMGKAQERLIRNALGTVVGTTLLGSIGAAARAVPRQQRGAQKPMPFVPPKGKRGRGRG
jgi:hypothetical protein